MQILAPIAFGRVPLFHHFVRQVGRGHVHRRRQHDAAQEVFDNILNEIDPTVAAVSALQIVLISVLLVLEAQVHCPAAAPIVR
jgi:hypothetical protein